MNNADIATIAILVICTAVGAIFGFSRGIFSFAGAFMGVRMAIAQSNAGAPSGKFLGLLFGLFAIGLIVGFMFYGATKFTPIDAMDSVFGAIFGLLMGWSFIVGIFYHVQVYKPATPFSQMIQKGNISSYFYEIKPWYKMMNGTTTLRKPDPWGVDTLAPEETPAK